MKKLLFVIIVVLLSSCTSADKSDDFFAMDTYMQIISLGGSERDCAAVKELVYEKDRKLKRGSIDLSDRETAEIIERACKISALTDGAFDITVAPLSDLWGFWNENFRVPTDNEIKSTLLYTGYDKISFSGDGIKIPDGFSLDFGAVAKGYSGDCIVKLLAERNVKNALISLGGNVVAVGAKGNGRLWKIGIKNPFGDGYFGYVEVKDKSVITSGGYERYFDLNGKRYSHIIDMKTGRPAETDIASVTVISSDGFLADALSTALYVLGSKGAEELITSSECCMDGSELSVVMILNDKSVRTFGDVLYKSE